MTAVRTGVGLSDGKPGQENTLSLCLQGKRGPQHERDYSHLGFALQSKDAVDASLRGLNYTAGCLAPRQEPYPVGYYCGSKIQTVILLN